VPTFKEVEQSGRTEKAAAYDDHFGSTVTEIATAKVPEKIIRHNEAVDLEKRQTLEGLAGFAGLLMGGSTLAACAGPSGLTSPGSKFYFNDGPGFRAHVRGGNASGKDYFTNEETLFTAAAEGQVRKVVFNTSGNYNIGVKHFGGASTGYSQVLKPFVSVGDYVGRYSIIAKGGGITPTSTGFSPPHLHLTYYMNKLIFDLAERKEDFQDWGGDKNLVRLDPEAQGQGKYGLELWDGRDLYSRYAARNREIIDFLDYLIPKASWRFTSILEKRMLNKPDLLVDLEKVWIFHEALKRYERGVGGGWLKRELTSSEFDKLVRFIGEYANLRQPLTLPFVNPALYKQIPGFYEQGNTTKSREDFEKHYKGKINLINQNRVGKST